MFGYNGEVLLSVQKVGMAAKLLDGNFGLRKFPDLSGGSEGNSKLCEAQVN